MSFYNTNSETGSELKSSINKSKHQEEIILAFFKKHPDKEFTPFEVQEAVGLDGVPITSIRRAITNLTDDGRLEKTDTQRKGVYGKKNFCWRLSGQSNEGQSTTIADNIGGDDRPNIYQILDEGKEFQKSVSAPSGSDVKKKKNQPVVEKRQQKLFDI